MSRIVRTASNPVFSEAVEYHNFVYLSGVIARDVSADATTQTEDVLAQIDALLETHGTDKTRLLQVQVWLKDMADRESVNRVWSAWLPAGFAPARACVQALLVDPACRVEIMVTACR